MHVHIIQFEKKNFLFTNFQKTGVDPTSEVWKKISDVCLEKEHIVYFDSAYQV